MKFIISLIFLVLLPNLNEAIVCDTCSYGWPWTNMNINCSCPPNIEKRVYTYTCIEMGYDCDPIVFYYGQCCFFPFVNDCNPNVYCPANKHRVHISPLPKCKCRCNNYLEMLMPSNSCKNLTKYDENTCNCECPPSAFLQCANNQYFDGKTCSCLCKEPCKDCSEKQKWNPKTCTCSCPFKKSCLANRYWNDWTCRCECKQAPRHCCKEMNKKWDPNTCNCVCDKIQICGKWKFWNKLTCRCELIPISNPVDVKDTLVDFAVLP